MLAFFTGMIHPLYLTAIRCQDVGLCKEAVKLLVGEEDESVAGGLSPSSTWKESGYDSGIMGRIANSRVDAMVEVGLEVAGGRGLV